MRHMAKVRTALMVVLIGLSAAGLLLLGRGGDPCREAYLDRGLTAQQMTYDEFRGAYGEILCTTDVASLSQDSSK